MIFCFHHIFFLSFLPFYISLDNKIISLNSTETTEYPRIIWTYYVGNMAPYIKDMLDKTISTLNTTWKYYFLTDKNISDYLNISGFPSYFPLLLPQHQSDIIRLYLLEKYGGWWMDTALLVSDNKEIERIYNKIVENKAEFYATCVYECPIKDVENGFMYAKTGSMIIKKWREEVDNVYLVGQENYIYNVYREGVNFPRMTFGVYPYINPYMVTFAAFEKVVFRLVPRNASKLIEESYDVIYTMHNYVDQKGLSFKDVYFNEELRKKFPVIKLGGWLRVILFNEKRISGYESYVPVPLQKGSKGGMWIGIKMINYLIYISAMNFAFVLLIFYSHK